MTKPPTSDHLPSLPTLLSSPIPNSNEPIIGHDTFWPSLSSITSRFYHVKQPNVKLRNFHLDHTAKDASDQYSSFNGTRHPLTWYISFAQLSPKYHDFGCAITTLVETETYEQIVLDPKWQEAMATKLLALEQIHS